jgi:mannose-6-phosphate isomerase-like protein (cupin superfamily)
MDLRNISETREWFEVLQTSKRSQTALMTLAFGASTGKDAETHKKSDQILLLLGGQLTGQIGQEKVLLKEGHPARKDDFRRPGLVWDHRATACR